MIDNPVFTPQLLLEMEESLPIKAMPTKALQAVLAKKGIVVLKGSILDITKIHYLGDEGGICCEISLPFDENGSLVTSMTHLSIKQDTSLGKKILRYQKERIKKLSRQARNN